MYGQRGSNGVVVITTKKGERGDFRVNFNSTVGFQNPLNKYETMNYGQWLNYRDTFAENSGAPSGSFSANDTGNPDLSGASQEVLQAFYLSQANVGDNYLSKLYVDDAITHNNNFNISGGNDKTRLYLGASHFYQEGTVLTQDFDRKSVRLNVTQQINDRIDFTGGISITDEFINQISGDNNIFGVLSTGLLERPGLTLLDENGEFTPYQQFTFSNPLQNVVEDLGKAKTFRTLANSLLTIHITDNLSAETVFGLDQSEFRQRIYFPSTSARGNFGVTNGYGREDHASRRIYQVRQSFNYDKSLSDDIRFRMYVGGEYETRSSSLLTADAEDFPNPDLQYLSAATTPLNTLSSYSEERRVSGISRMGFTFWNKLVLEGSLRADASSKFNKEDRIGYFPGASFAYTLSEENFMQNTFIDYFRLRASWGVTGNDSPFGRYTSPGVSTAQYADQGAIFLTLGDGQARWEETETIDVGFSTKFLNNRFDLSYAYYIKETKDNSLVIPFITSPGQGARQTNLNLASMRNFGHEIDLTVLIADTDNFSWSTNFNLGTLDNKVTFLPKNEFGDTEPINAGFANRVDEGFPLGFFYVLEADGLYQSMDEVPAELQALGVGPGDVRYVDQNGDGIINDDDFVFGGSPWADFTLNWSSQVRYKNFDFSFLWAWSEGGKMFNNNLAFSGISGGPNFNKFANQLNWWTPTNTNTDIPRPNQQTQAYNNQDSTRFIEDASYIKLRNITLGYTLPNIKGVHSARVYVSADNLVLITDYSGVDPEVNTFGNTNISRGTDFLTQGGNKVWKFGMNLSF